MTPLFLWYYVFLCYHCFALCLCINLPFALEGRFFKKTDTGLKQSLKKESIASYEAAADHRGPGDGKVRVDKTYRDPGIDEWIA